ncbi:hypothetical protein LPJ67_000981, partial [Coemansia sp. RSA 1938]
MVEKLNTIIRGIKREMDNHSEDSGQEAPPSLLDHVKELLGMTLEERESKVNNLAEMYLP